MALAASPSANQASFRKLSMVAFVIAMMGLFGNLLHLHTLTTEPRNDPSDLTTHYIMSDEQDDKEEKPPKQQLQLQQQQQIKVKQQLPEQQRQRRATLEEDINNNNNIILNNSNIVTQEQRNDQATTTTTTLLRLLLRESVTSLEACRRDASSSSIRGASPQAQSSSRRLLEDTQSLRLQSPRRRPLPRFGWLNTLNNYLTTSSFNDAQQQQSHHEECSVPSSQPLCHLAPITMSMMVLSQGTNLRCLFVNLLSWLLYSSVSDITVLLPISVWSTLPQDSKYGRRLRDWHDDPQHKVHFITYNQSLWEGVQSSYMTTTTTTTTKYNHNSSSQAAVVFMNGDVRWRGNNDGLQAGLALWQRYPASVMATGSLTVRRLFPPSQQQQQQQQRRGPAAASSERTTTPTKNIPLCKQQSLQLESSSSSSSTFLSSSVDSSSSQENLHPGKHDDQSFSILDLSGLLIHRDYLCLVAHHHVVKAVTQFASNYHEAQVAMSVLLTLASSSSSSSSSSGAAVTSASQPRLYPMRVRRHIINNVTAIPLLNSSWEPSNDTAEQQQQHESTTSVGNDSSGDTRQLRSSSLLRRLFEDKQKAISPISDETMTNIIGYFGSIPARPRPWCAQKVGENDTSWSQTNCASLLLGNQDTTFHDLNWLRPGTPEHDLCLG